MRGRRIVGRAGSALWSGILVGLVAGVGLLLSELRRETLAGDAFAIDGDSLRLGADEIRLLGLDAPELRQTCRHAGREERCGEAARQALAGLVADRRIACAITGRDRYDRKLGVCRAGTLEINRELVLQGQAVASGDYRAEEDEARRNRRGIWATTFEPPADWRTRHPRPPG